LVSSQAVEALLERPWHQDDEFLLLTVVQVESGSSGDSLSAGVRRMAIFQRHEKLVSDFAARIAAYLPEQVIDTRVVGGAAAEQIVKWATDWQADMIVLGTHGRKGFDKLRYGSVAEAVLKQSPCSVRIVKQKVE
ncbi:MAG: universal stress protein, partial [Candidatus Obscuribacterales bacterium]|nr:universal stress protein [Candidatus Obscuribacterales bacterium]